MELTQRPTNVPGIFNVGDHLRIDFLAILTQQRRQPPCIGFQLGRQIRQPCFDPVMLDAAGKKTDFPFHAAFSAIDLQSPIDSQMNLNCARTNASIERPARRSRALVGELDEELLLGEPLLVGHQADGSVDPLIGNVFRVVKPDRKPLVQLIE